eukprot:7383165-Prymnesium_polylepis.4
MKISSKDAVGAPLRCSHARMTCTSGCRWKSRSSSACSALLAWPVCVSPDRYRSTCSAALAWAGSEVVRSESGDLGCKLSLRLALPAMEEPAGLPAGRWLLPAAHRMANLRLICDVARPTTSSTAIEPLRSCAIA